MGSGEKFLVVTLAVLLLAGCIGLTAKASLGADAGGTVIDMTGKLNAAVRTNGANLVRPSQDEGAWSAPRRSLKASGADVLHGNHPLFRRPDHAGQNMYKVMCQGWGGWYYDPPSETYF